MDEEPICGNATANSHLFCLFFLFMSEETCQHTDTYPQKRSDRDSIGVTKLRINY